MRAGESLRYYGLPFIIGGDFNVPPEALEASGWPHSIHGRIQATTGTCRSCKGNWSTIDYFIVSRDLVQAVVALHILGSEPPMPHVPVRLKLARSPRSFKERVLKKMKQFPLEHPTGCNPKPPQWGTTNATEGLIGGERVDAVHAFFIKGFEHELCDIYGLEATERPKHCGRAHPPKFMWKQACGAASGNHPITDRVGRQWRLMQRRIEDIGLAAGRGKASQVDDALNKLQ